MRSRLKEAVCRIEGRGVHGSGFLIEYEGLVGILTANSLVPDKDTARTCAAIFHTAAGERVQVALLPETLFLSSPGRSKVRTRARAPVPAPARCFRKCWSRPFLFCPLHFLVCSLHFYAELAAPGCTLCPLPARLFTSASHTRAPPTPPRTRTRLSPRRTRWRRRTTCSRHRSCTPPMQARRMTPRSPSAALRCRS